MINHTKKVLLALAALICGWNTYQHATQRTLNRTIPTQFTIRGGEQKQIGQSSADRQHILEDGKKIPDKHVCFFAKNTQLMLPDIQLVSWPKGTISFALIVEDLDAPGGTFDHLVLFDIKAPRDYSVKTAADCVAIYPCGNIFEITGGKFPDKSVIGMNSNNENRYFPPCPPRGKAHRYRFTAYALNTMLGLGDSTTKEQLLKAIQGHILAQATLTATAQHPLDVVVKPQKK